MPDNFKTVRDTFEEAHIKYPGDIVRQWEFFQHASGLFRAKTVRVRVAVTVDETGQWDAVGSSYCNDDAARQSTYDNCVFGDLVAEHWIEADVPLPIPLGETFEAKVVTKC